MLSRTSQYALRAMIHLAQHEDEWPISGKEIARHAEVPVKYLSAVLSTLVRAGVLESARGKSGGFRMVRSAKKTRLFEVLTPFEAALAPNRPCPFGNKECSDHDPCLGHKEWLKVRDSYNHFLNKTSIMDIAMGRGRKN